MDETTSDALRGERLFAKLEAARATAQWAIRGELSGTLLRKQKEGVVLTDAFGETPPVRVVDETPEGHEPGYQLFGLVDGSGRLVGGYDLHWNTGRNPDGIGTYQIGTVEVIDSLRGSNDNTGHRVPGIGKALYRHIATQSPPPAEVSGDGMTYHLTSSGNMNEASIGMWVSLVSSGEAEFIPDRGYRYIEPNAFTSQRIEPTTE